MGAGSDRTGRHPTSPIETPAAAALLVAAALAAAAVAAAEAGLVTDQAKLGKQ